MSKLTKKPRVEAKCPNCGYITNTSNTRKFITCASCQSKVKHPFLDNWKRYKLNGGNLLFGEYAKSRLNSLNLNVNIGA